MLIVRQDLARRYRVGQWLAMALWGICALLGWHAYDALNAFPGSGMAAIGRSLLLAVLSLLTLAYAEYVARRHSGRQLAG